MQGTDVILLKKAQVTINMWAYSGLPQLRDNHLLELLKPENKSNTTFHSAVEQLERILFNRKNKHMALFKVLWTIDALASLVVIYFFFVGVADGTVSSRNMGLWMMILAAIGAVMLGSIWLRNHQLNGMAFGLLCVLAIPALFFLLYMLIAMFSGGRWN